MKKTIIILFLAVLAPFLTVVAQDENSDNKTEPTKTYQPNVRGSLLFAVGLNALSGAPEQFELKSWGSKSVNLYYLYDINIGNSKFSFHPGFGLGFEKYDIKEQTLMISYVDEVPGAEFVSDDPILIVDSIRNIVAIDGIKKNRIAANYFDIPLEFSFVNNKTNPKAGLKVVLGGKVGVLYGAHTKIKGSLDNEDIKYKTQRQWGFNRFRYSAHTRIGYGGFNLYFEYQFSDLFDTEFGGPLYRTTRNTAEGPAPFKKFPEVNQYRIGIAVDLF